MSQDVDNPLGLKAPVMNVQAGLLALGSDLAKTAEWAKGIPDPTAFGNTASLPLNLPMPYVVQRHHSRRAGLHRDLRLGTSDLFSWAIPKDIPNPGEKRLAIQQPLHCFPPDVRVETEHGPVMISEIVDKRLPIKVKSTLEDGTVVYRSILNYWRRPADESVVVLQCGAPFVRMATLTCTKGHRVISRGQKVQAGDIGVGDVVDFVLPTPNDDQQQILLGCWLGDGSLARSTGVYRFAHSDKSKEYFDWKRLSLQPFFTTGYEDKKRVGAYGKRSMHYASSCQGHPWFKELAKYYAAGKKIVSDELLSCLKPLALAVWYQDDGSILSSKGTFQGCSLATHNFDRKSVLIIRRWLKSEFSLDTFDVSRGKKGNQWEVRFSPSNALRFFEIVAPYIHPSMGYKLKLPETHTQACRGCGCAIQSRTWYCDTCVSADAQRWSTDAAFQRAYLRRDTLMTPRTVRLRCGNHVNAKEGKFVVSSTVVPVVQFTCGWLLPSLCSTVVLQPWPLRVNRKTALHHRKAAKLVYLYNLEVEETHRYVVSGGFVVGNSGSYADFEGEISFGKYGAGSVKTQDKGRVLVTKAERDKINFTVIHNKTPENYSLIRMKNDPKHWLLANTTPTDMKKALGGDEAAEEAMQKIHYTKVPVADVDKLFSPDYLTGEKIDGAAALYHLFSDHIEALSYRTSKTGRPIMHTYRISGLEGVNIPKKYVGTLLRGEMYGVQGGKAIPPQELGGILNSSVANALQTQKERGIKLHNAVFDIFRFGKEPVDAQTPYPEKLERLKEVIQHLPRSKFHLPRMGMNPEESRALWEDVVAGRNPRTKEGIVGFPIRGGKPMKVKLHEDHDVFVREVFPGQNRLAGVGAGGFSYSLTPTGNIVGEVGTGFTDRTRREMLSAPEDWVGRAAKVRAQEQFPSGALRAPVFRALHEDYDKVAAEINAVQPGSAQVPPRPIPAAPASVFENRSGGWRRK